MSVLNTIDESKFGHAGFGDMVDTSVANKRMKILEVDIKSATLREYIDGNDKISKSLESLKTLLMCINHENITHMCRMEKEEASNRDKLPLSLISTCVDRNELYIIQFLNHYFGFKLNEDHETQVRVLFLFLFLFRFWGVLQVTLCLFILFCVVFVG